MADMNLGTFKNWALAQGSVGKFNGSPDDGLKGQCVSLINQYAWHVLDVPADAWGHAYAWANRNNPNVSKYFDYVSSPQPGDIGVNTTAANGTGHIWIYLTPNLILEQNGKTPLRVTSSAPYMRADAILRPKNQPKEEEEMIESISDAGDLMNLVRQGDPVTPEEAANLVGKSYKFAVQLLSKEGTAKTQEKQALLRELAALKADSTVLKPGKYIVK